MNGGWFDLLRFLLGWKSSALRYAPPYGAAAAAVWHPGAEAGKLLVAGGRAGAVDVPGQTAGTVA